MALILAGGQSRRMGTDKALLVHQGQTLIEHVHGVASACATVVYIVGPPRVGLPLTWSYLPETTPGQGPLGAFQQSLTHLATPGQADDWLLLLACDLPYLSASTLRQWQSQLATLPPETIAYLPPHPKGWEALGGFYHWRCQPSLDRFVLQGGHSFQDWLRQQAVAPISVSDPQMLANWNTPEDRSALR